MYFHKIDHPFNFVRWSQDSSRAADSPCIIDDFGDDIFRVSVSDSRWNHELDNGSLLDHPIPRGIASTYSLICGTGGGITLQDPSGVSVLKPYQGMPFGVQKKKWVWCFELERTMRFYGMGEKNIGFEKSGKHTKFWNTDVWADFSSHDIEWGQTDPMYISLPCLLIHTGSYWIGILLPSNYPVFMDTGSRQVIEGVTETSNGSGFFYLGAVDSTPELYIFPGKDPLHVVGKIQRVCGVTSRPPIWALGYHQSRWGYASLDDLYELDEAFSEYGIPCDGLWLDIDYMDGYRVFSINEKAFPNLQSHIEILKGKGRRVIPILDPGVKADLDYLPCRDGLEQDIFCRTGEGNPYIGFVWPGAAYFPDFSLERGRTWWAEKISALAEYGFEGFWIDMNDPSTGSADQEDMLFLGGSSSHASYHNAYGRGMMQATFEGLLECHPRLRPFVLSRSGCIGSSRYGAVWTGDNLSNYHHLRKSVEIVLSLSLSGMPFAGPDIGGFGGDAEPENFIDWYKACYLFPFMRNHSADGTRKQEPWAFDPKTLSIVRTCIRARYAFIPYLYQLFIEEEVTGYPLVRPMFLHYPEDERFAETADQYMIGEAVMQAPNLWEMGTGKCREVLFPEGSWVDLYNGTRFQGRCAASVENTQESMHLFMRSGAIIPLAEDPVCDSTEELELSRITFLIAVDPSVESGSSGSLTYLIDDGRTFAYRNGDEQRVHVAFTAEDDTIAISLSSGSTEKSISCYFRFAVLGSVKHLFLNGTRLEAVEQEVPVPGFHAAVHVSPGISWNT